MRISDWSSDVCSSDLPGLALALLVALTVEEPARGRFDAVSPAGDAPARPSAFGTRLAATRFYLPFLFAINLTGLMQIISVSWIPTFLMRKYQSPADRKSTRLNSSH